MYINNNVKAKSITEINKFYRKLLYINKKQKIEKRIYMANANNEHSSGSSSSISSLPNPVGEERLMVLKLLVTVNGTKSQI